MKKNSKRSNEPREYKKRSGFDDAQGPEFEKGMVALLFLRCLLKFNTVTLASNVDAAGKHDDIVVKVGDTVVFIQLKFRGRKKVYESDLTKPTCDFCSFEYYKSYCDIKKIWNEDELLATFPIENTVFVLYTNAKLDDNISGKSSTELDDWQSILNTDGKIVSFSDEKEFPQVFEMYDKMCLNKSVNRLDVFSYKEFLSRFWLFAGQTNPKSLENLIQNDLGRLLYVSGDCLSNYYLNFFKGIKASWTERVKGYTLTERTAFWKEIMDTRASQLARLTLQDLNTDVLQFNESELEIFADPISKVTVFISDCAELTALKINQSLTEQKPLLVNISILLKHEEEVLNLWKKLYDVLVVLLRSEDETCDLEHMLHVLNDSPEKRLLLVGCVSHQIINHLQNKTSSLYKCVDNFNLKQLDSMSYEHVQKLTVNLQNYEVPIIQLVPEAHLSGDILVHLLSNETTKLGSCLKEMKNYLIPRTLKRKDVIWERIFSDCNDYFIIRNVQELFRFIPYGSRVCLYGQDEFNYDAHFIIVDEQFTMKDFDELCKAHNEVNFHWLNVNRNQQLVWKKSGTNFNLILQYLETNALYEIQDTESERLVIVVAEPGMGKTVLLTSVALQLKSQKPNVWVIHVILNSHAEYLTKEDSTAVGLLELSEGITSTFEKKIFHSALYNTETVAVLLDGFDEISPGNSNKVLDFVQYLLSRTKVKQLWLSSRPALKPLLEVTLSSLAYEIVPLTKKEQQLFLENFWNISDAGNFTAKLLDLIGNNTNDKLGSFTGMPLQLQMLTEVFKNDAECYKMTGSHQLPNTLDLVKLYKMFVKKKWDIYFNEKAGPLTNEAQKVNNRALEKILTEQHEASALLTLLTREEFSSLPNAGSMKTSVEELQELGERGGIITGCINGQPNFVHRTFQEYFAAIWLSKNFMKVPHLLRTKLLKDDFKLVLKFLDRILSQHHRLHVAILNIDPELVESLMDQDSTLVNSIDEGGRSVLHAAVLAFNDNLDDDLQNKLCRILDIILNAGAQLNEKDKVLNWTAMSYADALKAWKAVGILLRRGADASDLITINNTVSRMATMPNVHPLRVHSVVEPLHIAIVDGFFELFEYIISRENLIEKRLMSKVIHWYDYQWFTVITPLQESCYRGRTDMVQLLLNKGATVDAYDAEYNMTALMWAAMGGHAEIITLLLQHDANCNAQSKYIHKKCLYSLLPPVGYRVTGDKGHTALHLAAMFGRAEAVKVLLEQGADVNVGDMYEQTPLQFAVQFDHLEVAECLLNHGAQVNKINKYGYTLLHVSVINHHLSLTKCLVQYGADTHIVDISKRTALHLAALQNKDAVEYLLEHTPGEHTVDERGDSPIHLAASSGYLNAVKSLVNNGANLKQNNPRGHTPLHSAASKGRLEVVEWLIREGAHVDCEDVAGCTPLHLAALSNDKTLETAQCLIEKGATINKVNKNGKSPLHFAANYNNLNLLVHMLKCGAFVNQQDIEGLTPLHDVVTEHLEPAKRYNNGNIPSRPASLLSAKKSVAQCLINSGANVNQLDVFNRSTLHVALENGYWNIAELLVTSGAVVNIATVEGQTPLHIAAEMGHLGIIKMLVTAGSCINQANVHGVTVGHLAVKHLEVMKYLATCGADFSQRDVNGCTALHFAAEQGHHGVVQWLLAYGLTLDSRSNNGQTPLHFALAGRNRLVIEWLIQNIDIGPLQDCVDELLYYAVCTGNTELFHKMVKKNGNVKKRFSDGETLLHIAALEDHLDIVKALKDLGLKLNQRCYDGRTPLHFAARGGSLSVVEWLIKHGSKPQLRTNDGTTPLHLAARRGYVYVAQFLEDCGAVLHAVTNDNQTVMHFAAQGGNLQMIRWLLKRSVNLNLKSIDGKSLMHFVAPVAKISTVTWLMELGVDLYDKTTDDATVMHFALQQKNSKCIELICFLWNQGLSLHDVCKDGKTCIHFAAFADNVWWLDYAQTQGYINLDVPCADGRTSLHFAAQGGAINVLKLLKIKGCDLLQQTKDGRTALHFAALGGNESVLQWLLQEGADIHETAHDGRTALHFAAEGGHVEAFRWLIAENLNMYQRSESGVSVLHAAAKGGCLRLVRWLVKQGFNLEENSDDDRSLLHFAAEGGNLRVVQWLVKNGLDFHHKDVNNRSPLQSALENGYLRVVNWFLSQGCELPEIVSDSHITHPDQQGPQDEARN